MRHLQQSDIHSIVNELAHLIPEWETPQQARETRTAEISTASHATNLDKLPYNLDASTDTDTHIATRHHAIYLLTCIARRWQPAHRSPASTPLLATLARNIPHAWNTLDDTTWNNDTTLLAQILQAARIHSGHQPKTTRYKCLNCPDHPNLQQDYTDSGLLDIYYCPTCLSWWTPSDYAAAVDALALLTKDPIPVTQIEAAHILNQDKRTIWKRIKDRNIQPLHGKGKKATYPLQALTTQQHQVD